MRVNSPHARMQHWNVVGPGRHRGAEIGNIRSELREIGAEIAENVDAHGEEAAVLVERHLGGRHIVAPLSVADEMLGAIPDPAHRPTEQFRRFENERIFAMKDALGAEAAADVIGDDAHRFRPHVENLGGDRIAHAVHALAADIEQKALRTRIVFADSAACLHIVGDDAIVDDLEGDDMGGLGEDGGGLVGIADMRVISGVARRAGEELRGAVFDRGRHIDDRLERLPVDPDRLRAVARLAFAFRDDHGDDVADVEGLPVRHDGTRLERRLRLIGIGQRRKAWKFAETREVRERIDRLDPRRGARRLKVAEGKARVGVRTAQKRGVERSFRPII